MNNRRKTSKNQQANGSIRIIAGKHRGRKLPVLAADGLRPTTDRVKETVFNWLMPYMADSRCLDCFAGAGSLGFEAYSRGAEQVTMIELNKSAATQLMANAQTLKAQSIQVTQSDTLAFLNSSPQPFDIIFIDPPFRQGLAEKVIQRVSKGWLSEDAMVYVETESENALPDIPENWHLLKEKKAGQVVYRLFQVNQ